MKTKLIMCDDWRGIAKELRRQLKAYGLTVKTHTKREWSDQVQWVVEELPCDLLVTEDWGDSD
jgi:hypothetical protein